jgi:hypothetical protein
LDKDSSSNFKSLLRIINLNFNKIYLIKLLEIGTYGFINEFLKKIIYK